MSTSADRLSENFLSRRPELTALVMGVGGGGCNALSHLKETTDPTMRIVAVNTDKQALKVCPVEDQIAIGERTTRGFGTGGDRIYGLGGVRFRRLAFGLVRIDHPIHQNPV